MGYFYSFIDCNPVLKQSNFIKTDGKVRQGIIPVFGGFNEFGLMTNFSRFHSLLAD